MGTDGACSLLFCAAKWKPKIISKTNLKPGNNEPAAAKKIWRRNLGNGVFLSDCGAFCTMCMYI